MTPYAWKTPRSGVERLHQLDNLETELGFDIHIYRREGGVPPAQSALQ